jgi:hypothetical protein
VAIIIIVVVAVVAYVFANKKTDTPKRSIEVRGIVWDGEKPVSRIYAQSKIVIPGVDFEGDSSQPAKRFEASYRNHGLPIKGTKAKPRKITAREPAHGEPWELNDVMSTKDVSEKRYVVGWSPEDVRAPSDDN